MPRKSKDNEKPEKKTAKKTTKKAAVKKPAAKKTAAKKPAAKKTTVKKAAVKKTAAKKAPAKKTTTKRAAPKKTAKPKAVKAKAAKTTQTIKTVKTVKAVNTGASIQLLGEPDKGFIKIPPYKPKKGEEYMSDDQHAHFRQILNLWKQALMQKVDKTMTHLKQDVGRPADLNDRASQEEEFSLELRARDRERKLIKKIEETIEKINIDEYGYCNTCGIEIGIRRLEARPTASLCIDCKTLDEMKERQGG